MASTASLDEIVARFGQSAKAKLDNPAISGEPEDQLRRPLEELFADLSDLAGFIEGAVTLVGETSLTDLRTRPDYAVTASQALVGFIEVKAPGKGADPRKFKAAHDIDQWKKLQSLPNLIYTDGNAFSLWRDGALQGEIVRLDGDIESSGAKLRSPAALIALFGDFVRWQPTPPRTAAQLAEVSARLCRLLRDEVTEQLARNSEALTDLASDWRRYLFPSATDAMFADGYAQAVTFGLLMARVHGIALAGGLDRVAAQLRKSNSLIGTALRLLTDDAENQATLKTSLQTLTRVLDAVHWPAVGKGDPEAWLYFYESFLEVYDNKLRKQTGSYYTPPEVVGSMIRLVDEALRDEARFGLADGLASPNVTLIDPAMGTGTFLLGVIRHIARSVEADQGPGAVPGAIEAAMSRLIGFELQFGPYAVAQLRLGAEIESLLEGHASMPDLRLFVTNTLSNPFVEAEQFPSILKDLSISRRQANAIKRTEPITVAIGNPPYKEKAKGLGGWIESGSGNADEKAPLAAWFAPRDWKVGPHLKHLRNLYIYFWRWATWKVFGDGEQDSETLGRAPDRKGVIGFITVTGFLNGPGFAKMRAELRREADAIWVIDCTPEGHQPPVNSRVFQGVQQPVCIVTAIRSSDEPQDRAAPVRYRALAAGRREDKFAELASIALDDDGWRDCSSAERASFYPLSEGIWPGFPTLESLFLYNGSGVMPGRTWVIAPDVNSLRLRWRRLQSETNDREKQRLFHPHLRNNKPGDKHLDKPLQQSLFSHALRSGSVSKDTGEPIKPVQYAFRSFDRQWIIPDGRLINQPNPTLWEWHSKSQIYLTALQAHSPVSGPAATIASLIPDLSHYKGSFGGRAFPLWSDRQAQNSNIKPALLAFLRSQMGIDISPENMFGYIACLLASPAFIDRFGADLAQPGLRVPVTADAELFLAAAETGAEAVWLHTFGERLADRKAGRPKGPPRMPKGAGPIIPKDGAIPTDPDGFPDRMTYDSGKRRLHIGAGHIDNVSPAVWDCNVSGMHVLTQWFSYRKKDRSRPIVGSRRPPSPLGNIQPDGWLAEYTTELLNVLHILGRLIELEPKQADLLDRICDGPLIAADELHEAGALDASRGGGRGGKADDRQSELV